MSYVDDNTDWFSNSDDFNKQPDSPGTGNYNYENIDNIPFNDDAQEGFDLDTTLDDFQYNDQALRFSPSGHQQLNGGQMEGTSSGGVGQYQNMHQMQSTDNFDMHMQPSSSIEYNSFEMPTQIISSNLEVDPYHVDLGIDDPNSFYAFQNQQPSTSMGNEMGVMNDNYDMMSQQSSQQQQYMPQMDQIAGPSSVSNQGPPGDMGQQVQAPPPKPKPKKKPSSKKKPVAPAIPSTQPDEPVGKLLTKANKVSQQIVNGGNGSNAGTERVEARLTADDNLQVMTLMAQIAAAKAAGQADEEARLTAEVVAIFQAGAASGGASVNLLSNIQQMTNTPSEAQTPAPVPPKKAAPKKKGNNQHTKNAQQQQTQMPPQAQITPAKPVMDPPMTTMVPSGSYQNQQNDNYYDHQQQGTSQQQQQYGDPMPHHQTQQTTIQARVVSQRSQRAVVFNSQNPNEPEPSPHQMQLPQDQMEQMHLDQYQDNPPSSQQMYMPQPQQYIEDYPQQPHSIQPPHSHQQQPEMEPTLGDVVRQTHGRYQGPQDAPVLRQQLLTNVNKQKAQEPMHNHVQDMQQVHSNNNIQPYGEPMQFQEYTEQYDQYEYMQQGSMQMDMQYQEMYHLEHQQMQMDPSLQQSQEHHLMMPLQSEPEEYVPLPEEPIEMTEEELQASMEEKRQLRERRVKEVMLDQLNQLEQGPDLTPFRGRLDIFHRMLPYHHFTKPEEPVPNFDSAFQNTMATLSERAKSLTHRVRNIVLRDTMRTTAEWEQNMLLFLDTETERRLLEEDRQKAYEDPGAFLQNSEILQQMREGKVDLERTRQLVPPPPLHLQELDLQNGQLSALYREYEFDSYDENRHRLSPEAYQEALAYLEAQQESESEVEEEEEVPPETEPVEPELPTRSDLDIGAGFPPLSPLRSGSPIRSRNESESTWKEDSDSPLLSPETNKYAKAADQLHREMFGDDEELEKNSGLFPNFEQFAEPERANQIAPPRHAESVDSSSSGSSSSSAASTPQRESSPLPQPEMTPLPRSPSPIRIPRPISPTPAPVTLAPVPPASVPAQRDASYSPEIGEDFSVAPVQEAPPPPAPIPLPVPLNMIKPELEEPEIEEKPKLTLRISAAIMQEVVNYSIEDDGLEEIPLGNVGREPIKVKFSLKDVKLEEPSTGYGDEFAAPTPPTAAQIARRSRIRTPVRTETPVFKTPIGAPIKNTDSRKRRSQKIEDSPLKKRPAIEETPKNRMISGERFLQTMTEGRSFKIKIHRIPSDLNHFVTPRRDGKGNLRKDLTVTPATRLAMKLKKRNGKLSVEIIEKEPNQALEELKKEEGPSTMTTPRISSHVSNPSSAPQPSPLKSRPAPASRKSSIDIPGKDKKNHVMKNKTTFFNNFNPFAATKKVSAPSSMSSAPVAPILASSGCSSTFPLSSSTPSASRLPSTVSFNTTTSSPMIPRTPVSLTTPMSSSLFRPPVPIASSVPPVMPIRPAPIVAPKITLAPPAQLPPRQPSQQQQEPEPSSFIPRFSEGVDLKPLIRDTPLPSTSVAPTAPEAALAPTLLQIKEEPIEQTAPESPRASSSLSMSFFEDNGANGFSFLSSPTRTNEPLPVVVFSDDEETDLAHSTFSHATDHLLGTSTSSNTNGSSAQAPPILPWSTDS